MNSLKCGMIFFVLLISMVQGTQADDSRDYSVWKNQMLIDLNTSSDEDTGDTTFAFNSITKQTSALIDKRVGEAKEYIIFYGSDPVLWWIMGNLVQMKRGFYQLSLQALGKPYVLDASGNQALIKEYQSHYRKALELDDNPDALARLDGKHLVKMVQDVLSPPDIKKRAARKALDMSIAGGSPPYGGEVASYEWYMYEFLISAYAEAGDIQIYIDTVNEMMERYPNTTRIDELLAYKQDAEAELEKQAREEVRVDSYAQVEPYIEAVEAAEQIEPYVAPEVVKIEKSKKEAPKSVQAAVPVVNAQKRIEEVSSPLWPLLATGAVIVLFIIAWYGLRRRKR